MDPVISQVVQSQLLATIDDMGQVLARNAASMEIVEERDFAVGIVLERGEAVAVDNLLHLGAVMDASAQIQDLFQFAMKPGDVLLSNDPYSGGTHVQDFTALTPFHHGREAICYLVCRAHLHDFGGQVPGGYFPFADDLWAEGSRIPPLKIVQEGKIIGDKLDAVVINSRDPVLFTVNLHAMLAALRAGQRRMENIVKKYGNVEVNEAMRGCIAATAAELQTELENWARGTYKSVSVIDHDAKRGDALEVRAVLTVSSDKLTIDFSSSSPQSAGFINSTRSNTVGHALVPVYAAMNGRVPINSGLLSRTEVVTKPGSVVHAVFPAAVGWGPCHPGAEIISAVSQALSQAMSEPMPTLATKPMMISARWPQQRLSFPLHSLVRGGASAASGSDGWGSPGAFSRGTMPSVEMLETQLPMRVDKLELAADSAGEGQWRGGFGTNAEFEFTSPGAVDVIVEGQRYPVEPSAGGNPGGSSAVYIQGVPVEHMAWDVALPAGRISASAGGGGGWGDPQQREVQSIQQDMDDELLSATHAAEAYGSRRSKAREETIRRKRWSTSSPVK